MRPPTLADWLPTAAIMSVGPGNAIAIVGRVLRLRLRGMLTDPHGRPMVPTYATKRSRRYAYYETRKDLARPADPPASRFGQGLLERHVLERVEALLKDEHELRRIGQIEDGARLRLLIEGAQAFISKLRCSPYNHDGVRILITNIKVQSGRLELTLNPSALGLDGATYWTWSIPHPSRKPFREAKLRIDASVPGRTINGDLLDLLVEAKSAQELVLANPDLSLNQLGKAESRCRTHLARLLRVAWLSPRIVEAIATGTQPAKLNRQVLLSNTIPLDWSEQERQFGLTA